MEESESHRETPHCETPIEATGEESDAPKSTPSKVTSYNAGAAGENELGYTAVVTGIS